MKKRILSIIMCIVMLVSLLPTTVWAAEDTCDHNEWTAWGDTDSLPTTSGTYYLTEDVELSGNKQLGAGHSLSLCLNGHSITFTSNSYINVGNSGARLDICDCKGSGTISSSYNYAIRNVGTVIIKGGTVTGSDYGIYNGYSSSGGNVTVTGGTVSGSDYGIYCVNNSNVTVSGGEVIGGTGIRNESGTITVSGGTVTGSSGSGISNLNGGTVKLSGAPTISGASAGISLSNDKFITINGKLTYTKENAISVRMVPSTTGTFTSGWGTHMNNATPADYFIAAEEGYTVQKDGNELKLAELPAAAPHSHYNCGVENCADNTHDHSEVASWTAWDGTSNTGGIVFLTGNVYLTESINIDTPIYIETNGTLNLCLNGYSITASSTGSAISVGSGETLNICDCQSGGTITGSTSYYYTIYNNGTINIYGGTVTGTTEGIRNAPTGGTVNVSGGTVEGTTYGIYNYSYDNPGSGIVTVSGGEVIGGTGIRNSNSGTVDVSGGTVEGTKYGIDNTGTVTVSGGTVEATSSTGRGIYNYSGTGTVNVSGGTVNVSGGTVSGTERGIYNDGGSVNVSSNGTVKATSVSGRGIYNYRGTVTVSGGTVGANSAHGIYNEGGSVTVSDGTVTGITYGIYNTSNGTVNVSSNGTVKATDSNGRGIDNESGSVTVSGGTVKATGGSVTTYGIYNNGTLTLSGAPAISGTSADIYLNNTSIITITDALTYTADNAIRVKMHTAGTFTSGWKDKMLSADPTEYFTSAMEGYTVQPNDNELKLAEPHRHSWSFEYTPSDRHIVATCTEDCPLGGKPFYPIGIDNNIPYSSNYDGNDSYTCPVVIVDPSPETNLWFHAGLPTPVVSSYALKPGLTDKLEGEATITIGIDGAAAGTLTIPYTLVRGTLVAENFGFGAPANLTYNGEAKAASVTPIPDADKVGDITVKYYLNGEGDPVSPIDVGTYTVKIDVEGSIYYEAANDLTADGWTFTITKATAEAPSGTEGYDIDYTSETITAKDGYELSDRDDGNGTIKDSWDDIVGKTIYIRDKGDDNHDPSAWVPISIADRPAAPGDDVICVTGETVKEKGDGSVTGIDDTMEYQIDDGEWIPGTGNALTGLAAGTEIAVRFRATDSAPHGAELTVTILASNVTLMVAFDTNGGSPISYSIPNLSYGDTITELPVPTRKGYIFIGWYPDGSETMLTTSTQITDDIIYYAKWAEKANVNINETAQTYTWGGTAKSFAIIGTPNDGFTVQYKVDDNWTDTAPSAVGTYDVKITRAEDSTYKAYEKEITGGLVINAAAPTVTAPTAKTLVYDGTAQDLVNAGTSEHGYWEYSLDGTTYLTSIPTGIDTTTYTVLCRFVPNTGYSNIDPVQLSVTIAPLAIDEPTVDGSYTYTGSEQTVVLTGFDGNYMTITGGNKGTNAGGYEVVITLDSNHVWKSSSDGNVQWSIEPATPDVTWPTATAYVNDEKVTLTGGSATGIGGENIVGSFTLNSVVLTSAGEKTVAITFTPTSTNYDGVVKMEYTVTVSKRTIESVAAQTSITNAVYGTDQDALCLPANVEITVSGNKKFTVPVEWSGYDATNLNAQTLTGTLDLSEITAEVENPNSVTASIMVDLQEKNAATFNYENKTETYNGSPIAHEISGELEGFASISYSYVGTGDTEYAASVAAPTNAGTYEVTATFTMEAGYASVAPKTATLTVEAKEIGLAWPELTAAELVYSGTAKTLTATATGLVDGDSCTVTVELVGDNINVGTFSYKATELSNANYKLPADVSSPEYTITPKTLTITADSYEVYIASRQPELTYKVEGLVGNDTLTTAPTLTTDANMYRSGTYAIIPGGADAGSNYTVIYVNGTLTVKSQIITPVYPPVVDGGDNGDVSITPKNPEEGDTVVIIPDPDAGYEVDEITVTDENGDPVPVTRNGNGTYSFEQPNGKVNIEVTFKKTTNVCPCDSSCPMYGYTDLDMTEWYHDGVHFCIEHGLMQGIGNDQFDPNGTTTRAMIVTILWRLEGSPVVNYAMDFEDVAADQWYTEAIRWAQANGIVEGYGDGKFGTNDAITREQMVTIMFRYAKYRGYDVSAHENTNILSYNDAVDVAEWATTAMQWACGSGMIQGIADGDKMNLAPQGNATRAQAAAILQRYCENVANKD